MKNIEQKGVLCIYNDDRELVAIVEKDEKSRKNVFYTCKEMDFATLERFLKADTVKAKGHPIIINSDIKELTTK